MLLPLFAVHLSDGALSAAWLAAGFAGAAALLALALRKVREEEVPRVGVLTAAFFVASSVHVKLALLPTSVHLVLNGLVGVALGRRAPLAVTVGLTLQYFLLSHGGLTTIGINACIVSVPALAAGLLHPVLKRARVPAVMRGAVLGGGAVAGAAGLNFLTLLLGGKESWERLAQVLHA
ncbi:MAG: energy-coupling factor ABC transporter permease [Gemmata sp.]